MTDYQKTALEIYMLFQKHNGSFSTVSGFLRRNDSTKLSRQINPNDDRRDNPFVEVLEILEGAMSHSPELEAHLWTILERERSAHRKDTPVIKIQIAEIVGKIFDELRDVSNVNLKGGSKDDWEKESFELMKAAETLYEKVKQWKDE